MANTHTLLKRFALFIVIFVVVTVLSQHVILLIYNSNPIIANGTMNGGVYIVVDEAFRNGNHGNESNNNSMSIVISDGVGGVNGTLDDKGRKSDGMSGINGTGDDKGRVSDGISNGMSTVNGTSDDKGMTSNGSISNGQERERGISLHNIYHIPALTKRPFDECDKLFDFPALHIWNHSTVRMIDPSPPYYTSLDCRVRNNPHLSRTSHHTYRDIHTYTYIHTHTYIHIHTYTHIHTNIHTYTYIHMYI